MKCLICGKNEKQKDRYDCKECATKLFYQLNPFKAYVEKIFSDERFDCPDPKYAPRERFIPSPLPRLSYRERQEREWEREEIRQKEYPNYEEFKRFE